MTTKVCHVWIESIWASRIAGISEEECTKMTRCAIGACTVASVAARITALWNMGKKFLRNRNIYDDMCCRPHLNNIQGDKS